MKKIHWGKLIFHIAIPLVVGGLSALLTKNSMKKYQVLQLPFLAPPSFVFPIVWTILFILMGISTYLIHTTETESNKTSAYQIYGLQLLLNFAWPLIFFRTNAYLFALLWLIALIITICRMVVIFNKIQPWAGKLQIPYLLWSLFAAYLNFAVYLLN